MTIKTFDPDKILAVLPFTVEDDISYFCKYDDLTSVVATPNSELPAIADSCYVDPAEVFGF